MFEPEVITMLLEGIRDTLYMTLVSTILAYVIGLPMGIALTVTDRDGIHPMPMVYKILDVIANIVRSVPFIILLIVLIPFTKFIVGKSYGSTATIVPLVICAAPYIARMVESSLKEVDAGVIEAARSMGASNWDIIFHVLLVEGRTSLIVGATIVTGTILGYSAMSGTVGGGGLPAHCSGAVASSGNTMQWLSAVTAVPSIVRRTSPAKTTSPMTRARQNATTFFILSSSLCL